MSGTIEKLIAESEVVAHLYAVGGPIGAMIDGARAELAALRATVEAQAKQIETLRAVLKECKRIVGIYDIVPLIEDVLSSAPSVPIGVPVEEQTSECCEKWRTRNADIASYTLGAVVLSGARFKFCPDCGKPLGGA